MPIVGQTWPMYLNDCYIIETIRRGSPHRKMALAELKSRIRDLGSADLNQLSAKRLLPYARFACVSHQMNVYSLLFKPGTGGEPSVLNTSASAALLKPILHRALPEPALSP